MTSSEPRRAASPETWAPARRAVQRVLRPIEHFLHVEASSGIALLISAIVALVWANSASASSYDALWHAPVVLGLGPWTATTTVHFWINDGLMVIFFFVVGLEIRREIHEGELADVRRAALPIAAAIGGMIVPALIYFAFNRGLPTQGGWGVPMATDIAFAVGILTLLGKRVPAALRVLLLALAIIDDLGAIIVIALFYSSGVAFSGLLVAAVGVVGIVAMQRFGVRAKLAYVVPSLVVWAGMYSAGIHPTIAGVIVGLMTPVRAWLGPKGFLVDVRQELDRIGQADTKALSSHELGDALRHVDAARREAVSPAESLIEKLHPWVAFGIMPVFALANAGVSLAGGPLDSSSWSVVTAVAVGLILGKPVGVLLASWLALRLRIAALPIGMSFRHLGVLGVVAGVGFTMALFIAQLAFVDVKLLAAAKIGVLVASGGAAICGLIMGRLLLAPVEAAAAAATADEAESSTEA